MTLAKKAEENPVTVTIDGAVVAVPEGATILDAARVAGARIPTLCWHPALSPIGSCRVCLVEVEGIDRPATACNTQALGGMKIVTRSERLFSLRREVIKMILAHHPLNCAPCPLNGDCRLQDMAYEYDLTAFDFSDYVVKTEEFP